MVCKKIILRRFWIYMLYRKVYQDSRCFHMETQHNVIECIEEMDPQEARGSFQRSKMQLSPEIMCVRKRMEIAPP